MQPKNVLKKVTSILSECLVVVEIVIIIVLVLSKMSGGVPSLFGYNMYVIVTPSMSPELEVGDVVISRSYTGQPLEVDDVIQYVSQSGQMAGKIITHKIIWIGGENSRELITKGVANTDPDAPITLDQVLSVVKYKTVLIGWIYRIVSSVLGFVLLVVLPLISLIVWEVVHLSKDIKKELNAKEAKADEEEECHSHDQNDRG
jgi:signal peptidase